MGQPEPRDRMPEPTPALARDLQALFDDGAVHMSAPKVDAAIAQATRARMANLRRAKLMKWSMLSMSSAVAAALVLVALWPGAAPSTPRASAPLATADPELGALEADAAIASAAEPQAEAQLALADAPSAESLTFSRDDAAGAPSARARRELSKAELDPRDIDGNTRIDILDALAIARAVQAGNAQANWDFNGDGAVTQADVDVVAHVAVTLEAAG